MFRKICILSILSKCWFESGFLLLIKCSFHIFGLICLSHGWVVWLCVRKRHRDRQTDTNRDTQRENLLTHVYWHTFVMSELFILWIVQITEPLSWGKKRKEYILFCRYSSFCTWTSFLWRWEWCCIQNTTCNWAFRKIWWNFNWWISRYKWSTRLFV